MERWGQESGLGGELSFISQCPLAVQHPHPWWAERELLSRHLGNDTNSVCPWTAAFCSAQLQPR